MGTNNARIVNRLTKALERDSANTCLIPNCNEKAIGSHTIQKARLKLISEKCRRRYVVVSAELDPKKAMQLSKVTDFDSMGIGRHVFREKNIESAMKWHIACNYHDNRLFSDIENNSFDYSNPRHCLLLSYRAVLLELHLKSILTPESLRLLPPDGLSNTIAMQFAHDIQLLTKLKTVIENSIWSGGTKIAHKVATVGRSPHVAAMVAMHVSPESYRMSCYEFNRLYSLGNLPKTTIPFPLVATVLPDRLSGHIVLISYYTEFSSYVRTLMPSLWSDDEQDISVEISRFFLESSEHIHLRPSHWNGWTRKKRRLILKLFSETHPLPRFFDRDDVYRLTDDELNRKYNAEFAEVDSIDSSKVNLFI